MMRYLRLLLRILPYLICFTFFVAYSTLSIVSHDHYQSFGYDLGINDQAVWRYSHFQAPVTTIDPFPDRTKLVEHVELVYALIAPFYWIWDTRRMFLLLEAGIFCSSGIAVYLLARKKGLTEFVSSSLIIGYLGFYGVQFAMWFDGHSITFAAAFLMWLIYFLETRKRWVSTVFFILALTAKENIGLLTFFISLLYFIRDRSKQVLVFMIVSVVYVSFIFFVYFPHIVHVDYLYANTGGLFSNLNPLSLIDTNEKRQVIFLSLLSLGFLPLLSPLYLLPFVVDLATYFVIGSQLPGAQGLFGQYRITLIPFLIWATIISISKSKLLNKWYIGVYILVCTMVLQYVLHLPLSYLTKQWFWTQPSGVTSINTVIRTYLPSTISVVAQNNIVPHISHRDKIYSLYPEKKLFTKNSPCGQSSCDWFRWYGTPEYLLVDTSPEWDARHLLIDRQLFIKGIQNLEKTHVITLYKQIGTTMLFRVNSNPDTYK